MTPRRFGKFALTVAALWSGPMAALEMGSVHPGSAIVFTKSREVTVRDCPAKPWTARFRCRHGGVTTQLPAGTRALMARVKRVAEYGDIARFKGYRVDFRLQNCTAGCWYSILVGDVYYFWQAFSTPPRAPSRSTASSCSKPRPRRVDPDCGARAVVIALLNR